MTTRNLVPRADGEGSLGTAAKQWGAMRAKNIYIDGVDVTEAVTETAEKADAAATSATAAAGSASSASTTATQLMAYLEDKEELTAPAVDPTLTISGAAADAMASGEKLEQLYSCNPYNYLQLPYSATKTMNGVTYTFSDGVCTITGEATSASQFVIYNGTTNNTFPKGILPGKTYRFKCKTSDAGKARLAFAVKPPSGDTIDIYGPSNTTDSDFLYTIPVDAVGIRVRLYVPNGTTFIPDVVVSDIGIYDSGFTEEPVYKWEEHGVKEIDLSFAQSTFAYNSCYTSSSSQCTSNPIKLPKEGIYVYNEDYLTCRAMFVKKDNSGYFVPDTDYPYCYYGTSGENRVSTTAAFYPYKENTYMVITYNENENLSGAIHPHAITGKIEDNGGRLPNLQPNTLFGIYGDGTKDTQKLVVLNHFTFGGWVRPSSSDPYVNAFESYGRYMCSVVRLRDANKIVAAPPYSLVARIFKIDNDNKTAEKYEDIFARVMYAPTVDNVPSATAWSYYLSGVPVIDLTKYDFEGYAVIGVIPKISRTNLPTTLWFDMDRMGMLNKYNDVYNHVFVEWKAGVSVTYDGGMNSITKKNIETVVGNTFAPNLLTSASDGGYGCWITKKGNSPLKIIGMGKCSGWWYNATTRWNNPYIHVTPKSFITASKNRHSRVYVPYVFGTSTYTDDQGVTHDYHPLLNLYGSTCTFGPTISGGSPCGLEVFAIANEWYPFMTYREYENIDSLRAGDILAQGDFLQETGEETTEVSSDYGHVQLITEKVSINGETFCVNAIEGCQPWTRFKTYVNYEAFDGYTTVYRDEQNNIVTSKEIDLFWEFSSRTIGGYFDPEHLYTKLGRWKPESCRTFRDAYGTYDTQDYPVTEIMCDRGTDSVYCIGEHMTLTVTDGTTMIELRVNGSSTDVNLLSYPHTTYTDNGVTDVVYDVSGIITEAGYHEIYVNNVKKESFFVPTAKAIDWDITPDADWNIQPGKELVEIKFSKNEENDKVDAIIPFYVNSADTTHRQMAYIDIDGETVNSSGYCTLDIPYKMYSMSTDTYYKLRYVYMLRRTPYGTYYRCLSTYVNGSGVRVAYRRQLAGYNEV